MKAAGLVDHDHLFFTAEGKVIRSPTVCCSPMAAVAFSLPRHSLSPALQRAPFIRELEPDARQEPVVGEYCVWLALHPDAGDVVSGSGGCRKVRWSVAGSGKRGGVRVIYFNRLSERKIWLITMYAKNERASVPAGKLAKAREDIHHGKDERKGAIGARRKAKHRR